MRDFELISYSKEVKSDFLLAIEKAETYEFGKEEELIESGRKNEGNIIMVYAMDNLTIVTMFYNDCQKFINLYFCSIISIEKP